MPRRSPVTAFPALLAAVSLLAGVSCFRKASLASDWNPVSGHLVTRWAAEVRPESVHPDYPRPQLVRPEWRSLNGLWDYAIRPAGEEAPSAYDGTLLVPFPVESALSGVGRPVGKENRLWYRRTFRVPKAWAGRRVVLNFEAVDWESRVWVNGTEVGVHTGGYDPFSFDVSGALKGKGDQEIVLSVWDPVDEGLQPRGKQVRNPHGIWYTSVTGIWSSVWLEPVSEAHIDALKIVPHASEGSVTLTVDAGRASTGLPVEISVLEDGKLTARAESRSGEEAVLDLPEPRLWSPETPFLYDLRVVLKTAEGRESDSVASYFGLRDVSLGRDGDGRLRLCLNGVPLFQFGPLDQGWWPDGLYTAPTDEALRYDVETLKGLGYNMMRKHVKVEPRRFYYWCDKLGLIVWQDMPSGDGFIGPDDPDLNRTESSAAEYEKEFAAVIATLRNHPSIVMWVCFNEGWGQFDTSRITDWVRSLDPTRLIDSTSGWTDRGVGDVRDIHDYPGPSAPPLEAGRAAVLGEFGGLGLPVAGHTWQEEKNWGYRSFTTREDLTGAYLGLVEKLKPLAAAGLSAAVYTQTTDVEVEVNGLMTYDRAMIKMDRERAAAAIREVYAAARRK